MTKSYQDVTAVADLDLHVDAGEVLAVVGLNGAGKTTLMRLMLDMVRPDAGIVEVLGRPLPNGVRWAGVGHTVETPFAYPELTVRENLWAAALLHGAQRPQVADAVTTAIDQFALGDYAGRRAGTLSQGNRQRLGLASALVHRPRVVILDEPTSGLDPSGVVLLGELVQALARHGVAVIVSSHHLDEVARVAHRVVVMHRGRIVGELDPAGVELEREFFAMVHAADRRGAAA